MTLEQRLSAFLRGDLFKRLIRFGIVGGTIFIINTSLIWVVRRVFGFEGFFSIWSVFLIVTVCHFLLNNFFAFKDSNELFKKRIFRYIIFLFFSTLMNSLIVNSFLTYVMDNVLYATVVTTAIMLLINFTILNKFVFPKSKEEKDAQKGDGDLD